jgi:sugar phosphate isomerase/epimerase
MNNIISTSSHLMSAFPVHEAIKEIKKEGYTGIEIWYDDFKKQEKAGDSSYADIKKAIIQTGIKGVIHASIRDAEGKKLNICSKDEKLRKKSIERNLDSIALARQFGFHLVNMHPGCLDEEDDDPKEYWPLLFDAFKQFLAKAQEGNLIIAVEAMEQRPKEFVMHAEDLKKIITHFKSDNIGATLDIVHSFTHGEEFPLRHLEELGVHLRHFHASGFYGKESKTHCPFRLDEKNINYFRMILKKVMLEYDGIITIEGTLKGILSETRENQLKAVQDNMYFMKKSVGGF